MKKNIIYITALCAVMGLAACSNDPEDAVSKHVYTADESPYLRTDTSANIALTAEFRKGHIQQKVIDLKDYAVKIQNHLGMTVDEMISELESGKVVFYNININKGVWDKTVPNDSTGWGYDASGAVSDTARVASITLDKVNKLLVLDVPANSDAGLSLNENVGFAVNDGKDFDKYVRFSISMSVTDPGTVIKTISIPSGDYSATELKFSDIETAVKACFDMSSTDFNKIVQDTSGDIAMYMVDANGNWITGKDYTANGIGFWCDASGNPISWSSKCQYFVETHDGSVGIGRYAGIASGTQAKVHFVYASKSDSSKFMEFVITVNFE